MSGRLIAYCTIAQGGPMKMAVSDLYLAESVLSLTPESDPSFADIVLIESHDDAEFFANEQDGDGFAYASRIQTSIALNAGDSQQRNLRCWLVVYSSKCEMGLATSPEHAEELSHKRRRARQIVAFAILPSFDCFSRWSRQANFGCHFLSSCNPWRR